MAHASNVPVFGVRVGGANQFTVLSDGLHWHRVIHSEWAAIAAKVKQMMSERKNTN